MIHHFIKQGDAYNLPVRVIINGETVTEDDLALLDSVEFSAGEGIRKVYPEDATFDAENDVFLVPLTQEETFKLDEGECLPVDVRVKFLGGDVVGTKIMPKLRVLDALSEEVL